MEDKLVSGIYYIENITTNKKYIGQAYNIEDRWKKHTYKLNNNMHYNKYLQSAWNKYGECDFKFCVLEYCKKDELDSREKYYINLYNTIDRELGYNLKSGGQNGGSKYSDESRKKMSESQKELCKTQERKQVLSENSLKMWSDDEYRKSRSGENHPMYGKQLPNETRKKISVANKGKSKPSRSKEHCEAISKAKKGKESPKRNRTPVRCIETNQCFRDATTANKEMGFRSPNAVLRNCKGETSICYGYHFEFINKEEE